MNDRNADWRIYSGGPKNACITWRRSTLKTKGQFVREHCCGVRGKITVLVSARLLQPTALLRSGLCHINFFPIKNPPPNTYGLVYKVEL